MAEHGGHRRRRRALFEVTLGEGWEEARLLELALFEAIPRGDVYPLAQRLLERFGSLSAVSAAPEEELLRERGVGEKTARVLRDAPALLEEMRARAREAREAVARREAAGSSCCLILRSTGGRRCTSWRWTGTTPSWVFVWRAWAGRSRYGWTWKTSCA